MKEKTMVEEGSKDKEEDPLVQSMDNNLKGIIAEQLAKEMFIRSGYEVFNYGIEHIAPGFSKRGGSKKKQEKKQTSGNQKENGS